MGVVVEADDKSFEVDIPIAVHTRWKESNLNLGGCNCCIRKKGCIGKEGELGCVEGNCFRVDDVGVLRFLVGWSVCSVRGGVEKGGMDDQCLSCCYCWWYYMGSLWIGAGVYPPSPLTLEMWIDREDY